jgi:glycosyltransferase involved in cell wall biosynthesis
VTLELHYFEQIFRRHPGRALVADFRLRKALDSGDYDFVILNSGASLLYRPRLLAALLRKAFDRGLVVFVLWRNARMKFDEIEKFLGSSRYQKAKSLLADSRISHLAISEQTGIEVGEELGIARPVCVHNCQKVDPRYLVPSVPDDPPMVLNVGSLVARKGPDIFVEVARFVCERHPTVRFVWVGGRPPAPVLQSVADSGLQGRVEFIEFTPTPLEYMKRSSVFFLTSLQEAFGLVLAEAMACSRTVFCFSGTGAAEVAGETGCVIPPGDLEAAAREILNIVGLPASERVNPAARERYLDMYSPAVYARRFSTVVRGIVDSVDDVSTRRS